MIIFDFLGVVLDLKRKRADGPLRQAVRFRDRAQIQEREFLLAENDHVDADIADRVTDIVDHDSVQERPFVGIIAGACPFDDDLPR